MPDPSPPADTAMLAWLDEESRVLSQAKDARDKSRRLMDATRGVILRFRLERVKRNLLSSWAGERRGSIASAIVLASMKSRHDVKRDRSDAALSER